MPRCWVKTGVGVRVGDFPNIVNDLPAPVIP